MSEVKLDEVRITLDPETFEQRLLVNFSVIIHLNKGDKLSEEELMVAIKAYFKKSEEECRIYKERLYGKERSEW